jgi:hypothetical protein
LLASELEGDVDAFVSEIPLLFRSVVEEFKAHRALILRLMRLRSETAQLARSNPALLLLLAEEIAHGGITLRDAAELVMRRRRDIAGVCGCPAKESSVKILSRMEAQTWPVQTIGNLRHIIRHHPGSLFALRQLPCISESVISLISRWPDIVTCAFMRQDERFLSALSREDGFEAEVDSLLRCYRDITTIGDCLEMNDLHRRIERLSSASSLYKLHDHLATHLNRLLCNEEKRREIRRKYRNTIFPSPPIAGTTSIMPIRTMGQLMREAAEMRNCVASYGDRIDAGLCYIYRVLRPQRCTLSITVTENTFRIDELAGKDNCPPFPKTKRAVEWWLRDGIEQRKREKMLHDIPR